MLAGTLIQGGILIVTLYTDDLIYVGHITELFKKFKPHMVIEFEMTYLGEMHYFLGIEVWKKKIAFFCHILSILGIF